MAAAVKHFNYNSPLNSRIINKGVRRIHSNTSRYILFAFKNISLKLTIMACSEYLFVPVN